MVFIIHKNYFCLALNFGFVLLIIYTLPLLRTNLELRSLFFNDFSELFIFILIYLILINFNLLLLIIYLVNNFIKNLSSKNYTKI